MKAVNQVSKKSRIDAKIRGNTISKILLNSTSTSVMSLFVLTLLSDTVIANTRTNIFEIRKESARSSTVKL
tara:strand:- start:181 stop:393 length:213 start_codon:yes stop_codon:yes gene_type:complete